MEKNTFKTMRIGHLAVLMLVLTKCASPAGDQPSESLHITPRTDASDSIAATTGPWPVVCTGSPAGCTVVHEASGISLTLPENWSMSEPYFYQTAGGALADLPSTSFFTEDSGDIISVELNPRQWLASNGPCRAIAANELCMFSGQGAGAETAFESIATSLRIRTSAHDGAAVSQPAPGQ